MFNKEKMRVYLEGALKALEEYNTKDLELCLYLAYPLVAYERLRLFVGKLKEIHARGKHES